MSASGQAEIAELGIPVRSVNWVRLFAAKDAAGEDCILAVMGQQAENLFVLQIDPRTGKFAQHTAPAPDTESASAAFMARDGRLYLGGSNSGHLLRFDPKLGEIEDLGQINPGDTFPCRIDEAPDGQLFIGCYGTASLTRYDPKSGRFTRYGRLDEVDMYCYPLVAPDGIVAGLIRMTRPHIVLLDPKTGERKTVGPTVSTQEPGAHLNLIRGTDGELYITSSAGSFRIERMEAKPVAQVPPEEPARTLSDGATFEFADAAAQQFRELVVIGPSGERRQFHLAWEGAGTGIFLVHLGPDGRIYGSSILPLHLFRYDADTGELKDLGQCSVANGEAYSMANLDGQMYICSYGSAYLSVYDPSKPYHFGPEPTDNPRDLGTMDGGISLRPRTMLAGPLGRVWTGSYPAYGTWGGPLACYDPKTGEKRSYRHILPDQSVCALAWAESLGLIVGGASIQGGTGTQPKATEAALFLWDPVKERRVWRQAPRPGATAITSLLAGPDGMIYGIALGRDFRELFAFDPKARQFVRSLPVPEGRALECSLQSGPDGRIYGVTSDVVYRLEPGADEVEILARVPGEIDIPGPLVGKTLYFAKGHRLRALTLP